MFILNDLGRDVMALITKSFTVDADQLGAVKERLAKMNKKAIKIGIEPASITDAVERLVKFSRFDEITGETRTVVKPVVDVIVSATMIKFGDYTHVATLDHTFGEMSIVKAVPDQIVPERFHTAKAFCEHCNSTRKRKNTFIFKDESGYKQVGSTCLKEFFGIDPTQKLNWFSEFAGMNAEEFGNGNGSGEWLETNTHLISLAIAIVEKTGFVSSKQATDQLMSTSNEVKFVMCPPLNAGSGVYEYVRAIRLRAKELRDQADAMIAWGIEKFALESSDYAHNMRIFLGAGYTTERYFSYTVSLVSAYNRDVADKLAKEINKCDNQFIGLVNDKISVDVVVTKVIATDNDFGTSYINIMTQSETGNNLVWISSRKVLDDNAKVTLKGTIKALNVRDGKNQTILTRCKVI
jgi:hypothetical protein